MSRGSGYLGSTSLQTSVANEEIIPLAPENWTSERYKFIRFDFANEQECSIEVNGGTIYLKAGQGFSTDESILAVSSFKIVESGISFNWAGLY